jgi:hypothetical protein
MKLLMEFSEGAAGFGGSDGERPSFFIDAHGEPGAWAASHRAEG